MSIKTVFLVGCPRSGTTWLQLLLAQHPDVATLEETHVFNEYVSPMMSARRRSRAGGRTVGLGYILDDDQFREMCRDFVLKVLGVAMKDKPNATIVLEKTPPHLHCAADILELFPDARFIHIVRDPRAVVASLLDAGRTWGRRWAPQTAGDAAKVWNDAIDQSVRLKALTSNFTEVRYETLVDSPELELKRLLEDLGVGVTPDFCRQAVAVCSKDNLRAVGQGVWAPPSMKENLSTAVRRAETASWMTELSRLQLMSVEKVAGGRMKNYGYTPVTLRSGSVPLYWYPYDGMTRIGRRLRNMIRAG